VAASAGQAEITLRGVLLGVAMTFVFTAANVYLGLRVGMTFATSIPAAVISMALLRMFSHAGILENNIVQTIASAAGTLAAIAFVLPGLVMTGWWTSFPFWPTFAACATGGLLGVMFSIPLRRALVIGTDLPFPEGVAAAEVLKVGAATEEGAAESRAGLRVITLSSVIAAGYALIAATKIFAAELSGYFRVGAGATGLALGFQLALVGAGHLVGLAVGMALLLGLVIAWGVATPLITALHPVAGSAADMAGAVWGKDVRLLGAGAIGVAAIWALGRLITPIVTGLARAAEAARARSDEGVVLPLVERDIPIGWVGAISLALLVPIGATLGSFIAGTPLAAIGWPLVLGALVYVVVAGAFVAALCGYMAGLLGASNSPVSSVGILGVVGAAGLLLLGAAPFVGGNAGPALVAFALFATAIIFNISTISNDNLQDLKTGQLVGATPWRQQVALMIGVMAGAVMVPLVLNLLNAAYGFAGTARAATDPAHVLPAPQATLISTLAKGVLQRDIDWTMIGTGAVVGLAVLALDGFLGRLGKMRLPPLAVGMGIYLPPTLTATVICGAVIGHVYNKRAAFARDPEMRKRMGVLAASGMIVGESIFGVVLAGLIVASGKSEPLALVGDGFATAALFLGAAGFAGVLALLYRLATRAS
jgi:putative OPT family oligopeptide transporter